MQLVVLAGGLGTRLSGAIPDGVPKPMATIAGRPFLEHLFDHAIAQGTTQIHLLVGHAAEVIVGHFGLDYRSVPITYSYEDVPLGTGGAIKAAEPYLADRFVLANGDTFANVNYRTILARIGEKAICFSLAMIEDASRFGKVVISGDEVVGFSEKGLSGKGLINAGVYGCSRILLQMLPKTRTFSFEADFLGPQISKLRPPFVELSSGIVDIGTPESYALANAMFEC